MNGWPEGNTPASYRRATFGWPKQRQRIAFARESFGLGISLQHEQRHLQRDRAFQRPVRPLRQPDHRHATAPEFAQQPVTGQHVSAARARRRDRALRHRRARAPRARACSRAPARSPADAAARACNAGLTVASVSSDAARSDSSAISSRSSQSSASISLKARLRAPRAGRPSRVANRALPSDPESRARRRSRRLPFP